MALGSARFAGATRPVLRLTTKTLSVVSFAVFTGGGGGVGTGTGKPGGAITCGADEAASPWPWVMREVAWAVAEGAYGALCAAPVVPSVGWGAYAPEAEAARVGLTEPRGWAVVPRPIESGTYPRTVVEPAGVGADILAGAAAHRTRGRLPAVVWRSGRGGAVLARSAQPRAGLVGRRSLADAALLGAIALRASPAGAGGALVIMDARPWLNAAANGARAGECACACLCVACAHPWCALALCVRG